MLYSLTKNLANTELRLADGVSCLSKKLSSARLKLLKTRKWGVKVHTLATLTLPPLKLATATEYYLYALQLC